jgi:S1-C subfamily serine protease
MAATVRLEGETMKLKITLAIVLAAAVAGGVTGGVVGLALGGDDAATAAPATTRITSSTVSETTAALTAEQIYRRDAAGVVVITATQTQDLPPTLFSPAQTERVGVLGSGFVVDAQGDIVTNDHVVEGGSHIRVGFSSGTTYPAKIVGTDPSTDIAVIRVEAPAGALHPLGFTDSAAVEVGDPVYAIGNPFGLDRTMTAGIVSATGRDIAAPNGLTIPNAIQTDAPINHGNSGGTLLDRFGRVIGVNDQIQGGSVDGNVGVGFAVPSDTAMAVAKQLIAYGHAQHAWLGVEVETIDPDVVAAVHGLPSRGVVVARVLKGSPAAKAGLEPATRKVTVRGVTVLAGGDAIVGLDGKPIRTSQQLSGAIAGRKPGERVTLAVVRNGRTRSVTVTVGNAPAKA